MDCWQRRLVHRLFAFVLGAALNGSLRNDGCLPGGGLSRQVQRGAKKQNCQCRELFPHYVLLWRSRGFRMP
jgi:hypothetical protein